jgi:glycosyltransferase involved in cell wall biosynthesis
VHALRIAVATRTLAPVGGVESYVTFSVTALRRAGHEVTVFTEDRTASAPDDPPMSMPGAVARYGADVLVSHGLQDTSSDEALAAVHPSVFFAHAYHGTCISGSKAHSFPSVQPCVRTFGPACLLHYFPRRCGGLSPATMVTEYRVQQRRLSAVRRYDRVLAISTVVAREYERHGVPGDRIHVLPPPVALRPRERSAPDPDHLVYLGRLEPLKGPLVAVAAAAAAAARLSRPLRLTLAGEGRGDTDVRRAIDRLPAHSPLSVEMVGHLDAGSCARLLSGAGLLLVPSRWPEPFGLVGVEAAAHGVPAAAFRVGGIPEWLVDGISGHLAMPDGDPVTALCDAIVQSLADPVHYASLRRGAREAHETALARDHVGALLGILEQVARPRPRGSP